jgi:chitodextrinase
MTILLRRGLTLAALCLAIPSAHSLPPCAVQDFNADCKSDILWRNDATGQNYLYPMNGATISGGEGFIRTVADPNWQVAGIADFNGDGRADVLWRNNATGENYLYFMNGTSITAEGYLRAVADLNWQVAGVGDFNGDGKADILWRNRTTGESYIYFLSGLTILPGEGYIRTVADMNWQVAGVADFNGDGKADILWRNAATGQNYLYPMNGLTILPGEGYIRTVADLSWRIAAVADFDGDGKADVLWQNTSSGQIYLYPMNGTTILASEGYVRTVADLSWRIAAVSDFDGDGKADILWRNFSSGDNYLYPMNGTAIKPSEGYIRTVADLNWKVVPSMLADYASMDVGAPALAGQTRVVIAASAYDITAAGIDIYATADQFRYEYKAQSGDFDLRVRVMSLDAADEWSKAGLMARESMAADSREVSVFATPAGGYEFQYRAATGAFVQKVDSVPRVSYPNTWVRLQRAGNVFSSYTSSDGATWTPLGTTTLALPVTVFFGMAVTSHNPTQSVVAKFRNLTAAAASSDSAAPSTPGGLAAIAVSTSRINLSWSASTDNVGVAGYKVLRGGAQIATTTALAYADTNLPPSTTYSYTVVAYDAAGNSSAPSGPASATTQAVASDTTPPSIPAALSANAISASQINLSWSASTDNVGVAGYNVLRAGALIAVTSSLTYGDVGLSPSTAYTYTVSTFDAAGNTSAPSTVASATTLAASSRNNSSLGTNLNAIRDWSQEWTFVDAFHASRPWVSGAGLNGTWDDGRVIATDANGWVTSLQANQVARTVMFWDFGGHYPGGTYIVLYDGQGTIAYQDAATKISGTPGRDVLQVNPANGGISLHITATTAGNPIRNIRVLMPGGICAGNPYVYAADASACGAGAFQSFEANYAAIVFHPKFLAGVRTYRLLRFMDMGDTNDSTQSTWANRPKPTDARWSTGKGVPVEIMVDLANRLGADPWFNLPHLADNNYITQYARLVAQSLRTDLKAYIEYSNEVWNSQFSQAAYASSRGLALGLSSDAFTAQLYFYSKRSVEMFDLWSAEMVNPARLVRVMASQADNSWVSQQVLDFQNAKAKTDALAIAPYFGYKLGTVSSTATLTVDQLFNKLSTVSVPEAISAMNAHAAVAGSRGVPLISYEGGQHLAGVGGLENNAALNALFDAANRDARMAGLYATYLDAWKASGAQLFVHYTHCDRYSPAGRWGSLEYLEQPRAAAPKFDALQSFIERNPAWW